MEIKKLITKRLQQDFVKDRILEDIRGLAEGNYWSNEVNPILRIQRKLNKFE